MKVKEFFLNVFFGSKSPKYYHYIISALIALVFIVFFFPALVFPNKLSYRNYEIYSMEEMDSSLIKVLNRSSSLLESTELNDTSVVHDIYLCESFTYAKFWGLLSFRAFGWNRFNRIFIVKTDISKDLCFRNDTTFTVRSLSEVIAHEIVHTLQNNHRGTLSMKFVPMWKTEGYAEYVCKEKNFSLSDAKKILQSISSDHSIAADYARFQLSTQYLFSQQKFRSFDEFVYSPVQMEDVLKEIEK